jgi:MFS family permease
MGGQREIASVQYGQTNPGCAAGTWGRKPLLLIGLGVLPIRGVLHTFTHGLYLLVGIQVLDGIGAGIFGVVSVLVIADLTRGTGRFNLTLGAIATAWESAQL